MGLGAAHEQLVSDQIRNGLARYDAWLDAGAERLVPLRLDLTHGGLRYTDTLLWDANEPMNKAGVDELAAETVADLGLPQELVPQIAASLHAQQAAHRQTLYSDMVRGGGRPSAAAQAAAAQAAALPAHGDPSLGARLEWMTAEGVAGGRVASSG